MEDLVTIAEVEGHRVSYVASILESHGLTVLIKDENTSSMLPNHPSYWYKAPRSKNQVVKCTWDEKMARNGRWKVTLEAAEPGHHRSPSWKRQRRVLTAMQSSIFLDYRERTNQR